MGKPPISTEWTICDSEAEWNAEQMAAQMAAQTAAQMTGPSSRARAPRRNMGRVWWVGATMALLALAITGAWVWWTGQAGLNQIDAELSAAVGQEFWAVRQGRTALAAELAAGSQAEAFKAQLGRDYERLSESIAATPVTGAFPVERKAADIELVEMEIVRLLDDRAVVRVLVDREGEQYRQARFYRRSSEGWLQIPPEPMLLGERRRLETEYLVFDYFDLDATAVEEAAPILDAFVAGIRADFGLSGAAAQNKHEITVAYDMDHFGRTVALKSYVGGTRIIIHTSLPLPAWMPVAYSDGEAIVQAARPQLADGVIQEVLYAQDEQWRSVFSHWLPLLATLRLWEFWESDSPLANWRHAIIEMGMQAHTFSQEVPAHYGDICHAYRVWNLSPSSMGVPLACESPLREPYLMAAMPDTPGALLVPEIDCCESERIVSLDVNKIALTTVLDYAVATYGRERLPALLGALGEHEDWDTLIPAVFGVSVERFEAGWQEYVAARYR